MGADREPGSTLPLAEQFRFDAGSPGLNLLATLGYRGTAEPVERLTSPSRYRDWLSANGLPNVEPDARAVAATRAMREAGYAVLAAVVTGDDPRPADVAILGRWAARPIPAPGLAVHGATITWVRPPATVPIVLAGLARELAELAVSRPAQLRMCTAPACRMIYLDGSRGRRRRWCSMARCGNAAKVARHRALSAVP